MTMKARIKSTGEIIDVMAVISGNMDFTNVRCYPEDDIEIINSQHPEATRSEEQRELLNKLADEYAADNSIRVGDRCHDAAIEECVYNAYIAGAKVNPSPRPAAPIEGWVAVDDFNNAYIYPSKPTQRCKEFCDTGDYVTDWSCNTKYPNGKRCYVIDKDLFPDLTPESKPLKVKILITTE